MRQPDEPESTVAGLPWLSEVPAWPIPLGNVDTPTLIAQDRRDGAASACVDFPVVPESRLAWEPSVPT